MHVTKVVKVGNGYYVNLRYPMVNRMNLGKGSLVSVELTEKGILIRPLKIEEKENEIHIQRDTVL